MFKKIKKEKYKKFKPLSRKILVRKRLEFLESKENLLPKEEIHKKILGDLNELFPEKDDEVEDAEIYDSIIKDITEWNEKTKNPKDQLSPFVFIRRYSTNEQYDILPDTMQADFDDIPDENGMTKFEVVETIQRFGEILNNIISKEQNLNSKLDCSLYAEQYLDTLEQVATLYRKSVIPKKAADYFENKFSYGINLLDWYNKFVNNNPVEFKPDVEVVDTKIEKEERWTDFRWFCRGGDLRKIKITKFSEEKGKEKTLPDVMYDYDLLPNEEGLTPKEVLEIMRNYSKQLTDLSGKEPGLKTQIDCSVYAEQYLDTLEQIAYLFNNKSLVTDSVTYFENNFTYGLTLKKWYTLAVIGADSQENRWKEFDIYCNNFKDEKNIPKKIKSFEIESVLPPSMLNYQNLPTDQCTEENKDNIDYERKKEIP